MHFNILTIFPNILDSYINESILKRARERNFIMIDFHDIRDYATGKHAHVDDTPYGGGPGMIFKVEPIFRCLEKVAGREAVAQRIMRKELIDGNKKSAGEAVPLGAHKEPRIILMSPQGAQLTQQKTEELAKHEKLILVCGRYEGVDARIRYLIDEEISIGPYVLSGGELPAMVVVETVARLVHGVLGSADSLAVESYFDPLRNSSNKKNDPLCASRRQIEYPQYTRPEIFEPIPGVQLRVPEILLSGDHKKIGEWERWQMS
jgi:tRNA (guanine37-N1)-methyltransferase